MLWTQYANFGFHLNFFSFWLMTFLYEIKDRFKRSHKEAES